MGLITVLLSVNDIVAAVMGHAPALGYSHSHYQCSCFDASLSCWTESPICSCGWICSCPDVLVLVSVLE